MYEVKMEPPRGWLDVSVAAVENWDVVRVGNAYVVMGGVICANVRQTKASTARYGPSIVVLAAAELH